jgi:16S rRNA (guanine966-N2)-methyltransferase
MLRIIGGALRSRHIKYSGDLEVRPMKDRTREAVFNVLGPLASNTHVIDLFAGTGAMSIEAISRGAGSAVLVEHHLKTARTIRENIDALNLKDKVQLVAADAFAWAPRGLALQPVTPWLVFCCPPYRFYCERLQDLQELLGSVQRSAPSGSQLVAEAELPFDFGQLQLSGDWDIRQYRPAVIGFLELPIG